MDPMTFGSFAEVMDARVAKIAERIRVQCPDNQGPGYHAVNAPLDWGVPSVIQQISLFRDVSRPGAFGVQLLAAPNSGKVSYIPWATFPVMTCENSEREMGERNKIAGKSFHFLQSARFFHEVVRVMDTLETQLLTDLTTNYAEWLSAVAMFRQVK